MTAIMIYDFHPSFPRTMWSDAKTSHKLESFEHALEIASQVGPLRETPRCWFPDALEALPQIREIRAGETVDKVAMQDLDESGALGDGTLLPVSVVDPDTDLPTDVVDQPKKAGRRKKNENPGT